MAKNFIFQRRINGSLETFYPKTATDNVIRETENGEKKLDTILDNKGAFIQYNGDTVNNSGKNDLMFEFLGDVANAETVKSTNGTIISDTAPDDTNYLWLDKSGKKAILKYYNPETENWKPVTIGNSSGIELTVDEDGLLNVTYDDGE